MSVESDLWKPLQRAFDDIVEFLKDQSTEHPTEFPQVMDEVVRSLRLGKLLSQKEITHEPIGH